MASSEGWSWVSDSVFCKWHVPGGVGVDEVGVCLLTNLWYFPRGRAGLNQGGSSTQQQHHLILNETHTFWPSV